MTGDAVAEPPTAPAGPARAVGPAQAAGAAGAAGPAGPQIALIDLLDRLLNGGAVLTGDLVLSIADVDLVRIGLRAVIHSIVQQEPVVQPEHPILADQGYSDHATHATGGIRS